MEDYIVNTMVGGDAATKIRFLNAYNNADSLNNHMNETLLISDVFIVKGQRKSYYGGEVSECYNTYLIGASGDCYFTQSNGVAKSVMMIVANFPDFGKDSYEGGLRVRCIEKTINNGNRMKTLELVM